MLNGLDFVMIGAGLRALDKIENLDNAFTHISLKHQPFSAPEILCCLGKNLPHGKNKLAAVRAALRQVPMELINRLKTELRFRRKKWV